MLFPVDGGAGTSINASGDKGADSVSRREFDGLDGVDKVSRGEFKSVVFVCNHYFKEEK